MSGLETLPPDQRAVLQLILKQGRGYADLASLLKIELGAVRSRALAGLDALGAAAGNEPAPADRAQIGDYLLGQQDDGERLITLAQLGESPAAARWAQALRAQLTPLARDPLPEVPAPISANGGAAAPAPVAVATAATAASTATPPPPEAPRVSLGPLGRRPSRLGGAILIGAVTVLVAVLAIVVLNSGGSDGSARSSASTSTPPPRTTQSRAARTTTQPTAPIVAQVNLTAAPGAGQAIGLGLVQASGQQRTLAVEAQKLPANGAQELYGMWLQGPPGAKFLGFVPQRVGSSGAFTVSARLPSNAKSFTTVLVTRESTSAAPTHPGVTVLRGGLTLH